MYDVETKNVSFESNVYYFGSINDSVGDISHSHIGFADLRCTISLHGFLDGLKIIKKAHHSFPESDLAMLSSFDGDPCPSLTSPRLAAPDSDLLSQLSDAGQPVHYWVTLSFWEGWSGGGMGEGKKP